MYNKHKTPPFSGEPPPNGFRILVLNRTYLYSSKAMWYEEVEPVWCEAYWWNNRWLLWCGKLGVSCTDKCDFDWWAPKPKPE